MMNRTCLAPAILALLTGCALPSSTAAGTDRDRVVGTYEILLCRRECSFRDTAGVIGRGFVVLDSVAPPLTLQQFEVLTGWSAATDSARQALRQAYEARERHRRESVTGCTNVRYRREQRELLWRGFTMWARSPAGEIRFPLWWTVDAGYRVEVSASGRGLAGRGTYYEVGPLGPADFVQMRKVGPPDVSACLR